jgi:hypothetical protein
MSSIFLQRTEDRDEIMLGEYLGGAGIHDNKPHVYLWAMMHIDGVNSVFGKDVYSAVYDAKGKRIFIEITATVEEEL